MRLKILCPYKLCKSQQVGPLLGVYDTGIAVGATAARVKNLFSYIQEGHFMVIYLNLFGTTSNPRIWPKAQNI